MMLPAFFCSIVPPFLTAVLLSANGAADAVFAPAVPTSSSAALIPMTFRMLGSLPGSGFEELRRKRNNSAADVNRRAASAGVRSVVYLAGDGEAGARRPGAGRPGPGAVAREGARADP